MGEDAHQPSQSAQVTPQTAELRRFVEELAGRLEAIEAQRARAERMADLLDGAAGQPLAPPPKRRKRPNPHNLHIVRGFALAAAGTAGWFLHSRVRRAAAMALIAATATGATVAPGLLQPAPAAQMPDFDGHHHHHHVERHHRDGAVLPVAMPPRRRRRRPGYSTVMPGGSPRPSAAPQPSPQATAPASPVPSPSPGLTLPPLPLPTPACTWLTGHHCHDEDGLGDAVGVLGALTGES